MNKLLGIVAVFSGLALVACGDSGSDVGGGTEGGGNAGGSPAEGGGGSPAEGGGGSPAEGGGGAGEGGAGGGGTELTCEEGCNQLYVCGTEEVKGEPLCAGFSGEQAEQDTFVDGCVTTCEMDDTLLGVINPDDCPGTITIAKAGSPTFEMVCDNGFGQ